jgi:hypothetical protein
MQTKHHLEKIYGKGLLGMFNDNGELEYSRMRQARNRPAANWITFGGQ